jgi:hypothetical protein
LELNDKNFGATLKQASQYRRHRFVVELLTPPAADGVMPRSVASKMKKPDVLVKLVCMHVDLLQLFLSNHRVSISPAIKQTLLNTACRNGHANVVKELLENHQSDSGDWTVDDFNAAAPCGNVHVLRLLGLSHHGGFRKLANNPLLKRMGTQLVLGEMCAECACVDVVCQEKIRPRG